MQDADALALCSPALPSSGLIAQHVVGKARSLGEVRVMNIIRDQALRKRPLPMNTVAMLQQASEKAGLSPAD